MLSDKMAVSLVLETIRLFRLLSGESQDSIMFRLDYLPSGLKSTRPDQPRRGLLSFIPLHCAARLRACAVSNIETSRQKTFVRLNKVERGKEFYREWRMYGARKL